MPHLQSIFSTTYKPRKEPLKERFLSAIYGREVHWVEYVWFGKSASARKAELSLHINRKMNLMFIASCGFVCPRNTTTTVYSYKAPSGCSIRAQCDNWLLCKSNWLDFYVPQQADSITMSIIFLLFFFIIFFSLHSL